MRRLFFVLILMFACSVVSASESDVTLYGRLDVGYGVGNGGEYETRKGNDSKFQQWGNGKTSSRWGLKGSENLNNKMKVFFTLESGINPETGVGSSKLFNRASYVGISGDFGAFKLGRQNTLHYDYLGQFDISGGPNTGSAVGNVGLNAGQRKGGAVAGVMNRFNSATSYSSPQFYNFQMHGSYVMKNDGDMDKDVYALALTYLSGNLSAAASFESKYDDKMNASWGVGAKYKFPSFTLGGGFFNAHQKIDGYGGYLGIVVPVNRFKLGAEVAYNHDAYRYVSQGSVTVKNQRLKPFSYQFFGTYDISKRTELYLNVALMNEDAKEFMMASRKYSAIAGIVHKF